MKTKLYLFLILISCIMSGCNNDTNSKNSEVTHPIVGHNFASSDGKISLYFATDNTVKQTFKNNGETVLLNDFTYKITGNTVEIYYGYKDWKDSVKGTIFTTFIYNSKDRTLYSNDYGTLHYVN